MAKLVHFCTDRVLPSDLMRFRSTVRRGGVTRAIMPIGKLWMNGSTRRVRFIGGTAAQQAKAQEQALWWTAFANLHFDFNNAADAEIRVGFDPTDGAWSYIGTDNRNIPTNQPTMNLGFMDGGTAGHEFGHGRLAHTGRAVEQKLARGVACSAKPPRFRNLGGAHRAGLTDQVFRRLRTPVHRRRLRLGLQSHWLVAVP